MGRYSDSRSNTSRNRDAVGAQRSRAVGCWNCGLPHHVSKNCTASKAPRCAFCRKRGVRTEKCRCTKREEGKSREDNYGNFEDVPPRKAEPVEPATLVVVHQKWVKAVVDTGSQESRMGSNVFNLVRAKQNVNPRKHLIKTVYGIESVRSVEVRIGIHQDRKYSVEFIIDSKIPANEIILGMPALKILGYRITIGGKETRERPASRILQLGEGRPEEIPQRTAKSDQELEEDAISFLDEEEAKRIREWEY